MKKIFKVTFINILVFITLLIVIELIFGHWFDKDNFGPYMREHRMKKTLYQLNYKKEKFNFEYRRNYHAFRGNEIKPEEVEIIMVGGSTTDERYKPEKFTIVGRLNEQLNKNNILLKIINAGVEGQSTRGHLSNFRYWFNKIDKFKPKFIIYYVGINDSLFFKGKNNDLSDGWIQNPNYLEAFFDNIKSRSLIYDMMRKTKHKYYRGNETKRVIYDFNFSMNKNNKINRKYLNYSDEVRKYNFDIIKIKYENIIKNYLNNIDQLAKETYNLKAIPIFINQATQQGEHSELLFALNTSLIDHCHNKNYKCIDLVKEIKGRDDYWWDGIHTTPEGSESIARILFPYISKYIMN